MTKAQAVAEFNEEVMPLVRARYEQDGVPDRPARAEAWNDFTDYLQKNGRITAKQYSTWLYPRIPNPCGDYSRFMGRR
jgi:hypothetical protein